MNPTLEPLARVAAVCAAIAGTIFVAVQINHPPLDLELVGTTEFTVRQSAKSVMAVLALVGIAGLYLCQARAMGKLGLIGYVLFTVGYFAMFAVESIATFTFATLESSSPGYVQDVLTAAAGGTPESDIGAMQVLLGLSGAGYMLGGLLFGIALVRAGIVARWAGVLLAVGTVGAATLAFLPESFNRPVAVPAGIALIGLGVSLWRSSAKASA